MKKNTTRSKATRNLPAKTLPANMAAGVRGGKPCCKGSHIPEVKLDLTKADSSK